MSYIGNQPAPQNITDSDIASDAAIANTKIAGLSTVATSGAYSDVTGTPTLATVATTGAYADVTGTPTLATVATTGAYSDVTGTPTLATVATTGAYSDVSGTPTLATVATTGAYADVTGTPTIPVAGTDFVAQTGGTFTGDVSFGDNDKAIFGAGSDLQIYHDGSHSYIKDNGNGDLILQGSDQVKIQTITGETMVSTNENNAVVLYYDNAAKLQTTSTGIDVTGELIADSYNETYAAVTSTSNATTVNCESANSFSHTLTENTTFTFSNPPASGTSYTFSIEIIQDASASGYTVTWPAGIISWPAATAPTLTATASAKDIFVFTTRDGGTTWYGFTAGQALA